MKGSFEGLEDDLGTGLLVAVKTCNSFLNLLGGVDVSTAAAEDNAFLDCCSGSIEGIFHTEFGFLHLCLGRRADADDCYAACQLGKTLLQLLSVEIGLGLFNLLLDLGNALIKGSLVAKAIDDDSLLFRDFDTLGAAELLQSAVLELKAEVGADDCAAGQDRDILQHCFPSVAIAGSLDSDYVEGAAQFVDDQGGQSLALNILCDDEELGAHLDDLLENGKDILDRGDLLICDQDERIFQICFHLVHISCHVSADIASVKLHTFDQVELGQHGLGLFDSDDAVFGNLFHGIRDHSADILVAGRDGCDLLDVVLALDGSAHSLNCLDSGISCFLHALAQDDGIRACSQVLHTFVDHGLGQNSCGSGAVTCDIVGLGGNFLDELGAHVFKSILELDFLCDGHAVICNSGSAISLVQDNVPALGSQCDLYCISEFIDTFRQRDACVCAVLEFFSHYFQPPKKSCAFHPSRREDRTPFFY